MKRPSIILLQILLALPSAVLADICPDKPPPLMQYSHIYTCPAATITVEGSLYAGTEWECFGLVPNTNETVFYSNAKRTKTNLPSVAASISNTEKDLKERLWVISEVRCLGETRVTVRYWAGGRCKGCEREVWYLFSKDGNVKEEKVR